MVEHHTEAASGATGASAPSSGNKVRLYVRIVLFAILAYLLCALPYDYLVARPGHEKAWLAVEQLLENNHTSPGRVTNTDETIHELLGRQPTTIRKTSSGNTEEVYTWRAGLPFKKYDLYVTYGSSTKDDKLRLLGAHPNESPETVAQFAGDLPASDKSSGGTPISPMPIGGPPGVGPGQGGPGMPPGGGPGRGGQGPTRPAAEEPAKKPSTDEKPGEQKKELAEKDSKADTE